MSTSYGAGKQGVAILPLALIVVLHLLLILLWATRARTLTDQAAEQRQFTVTWLQAPKPRAQPPVTPTAAVASAPRTVRASAAPVSRGAPQPAPAPASTVEPIPRQDELPQQSSAVPTAAPDALDASQMIESAKRQAGMIDRELRGGKPAPLRPDSELPIARLRSALEGAYNDRSTSVIMDTLTQADGVVVYRFRHRGKVWCRQSGGGGSSAIEYSEGAKLAGAGSRGGAGVAGHVQCPGGESGWSRR